ncbi:MAG: hypothetical protein ACI392_06005 [Paludibacteraceae bacterium]
MKKITIILTIVLSVVSSNGIAQQAVAEALSQAEKVSFATNQKALKAEQKALKKSYANALKEIASRQTAAQKKPALYEQLTTECETWNALQMRMERLVAEGKWNAAIAHVDYDSLQTDINEKAASYYYTEGRKMSDKGKDIVQKRAGIAMMANANRFSDTYAATITLYQDSIELPFAHNLAQSSKEDDLVMALQLFNEIAARHANDSAMYARITPDRKRLQTIFYDKAEKLFGKEKYQAQYDAARYYAMVDSFRDAADKERLAHKRGVLSVAVVDVHGNLSDNLNAKTVKQLQKTFPDYFDFTSMQGLTRDELKEKRCALLFVYDSTTFGNYQYAHRKNTKDKSIVKYMQKVSKNGVISEKEISEKEYHKGKAQNDGTENFNMYQGRLHKMWIESVMDIDYTFDIVDLRADSAQTVGAIEQAGKYTVSEIGTEIVTYKGDIQCRPSEKELINRDQKLTNEDLDNLAKEQKIYGWSIDDFLYNRAKAIDDEVERALPYKHFTE